MTSQPLSKWHGALWYRDWDGRDATATAVVAQRLETAGITPEQLQELLRDLTNGHTAEGVQALPPRSVALVAIELDALGALLRELAAELRSDAIRAMAEDEPIAEIAKTLGLSRQAASRSANTSPRGLTIFLARTIDDARRSIANGGIL